ncbi:MAG: aldehyde dehydrogenase family protein [Nitrospirae bacterium]|nr:aldehyde dehydrogenase family protein [Nitrospirota bacterium]MBI3593936.1 aldehyde dehydrogenase family protein [Nitrospirota bacterium]
MTAAKPFYSGGKWEFSSRCLEVVDPYRQVPVASVCLADRRQVAEAIGHTVSAFQKTKKLDSFTRSEILHQISDGIAVRKEEFAKTISLEAGKPISDARVEVGRAIFTFLTASEEAKRIGGEVIPLDLLKGNQKRFGITKRFPLGPILAITPFNFPINLVAHKAAPAIASGNSLLLKPAPQTPLTALLLAEVVSKTDLPKGSFNVIPCDVNDIQQAVLDDRIKMLTFTGSGRVGWRLKEICRKKKVVLELGGNAGVIIDDDAELEYAAGRCVTGGFTFAGQSCISVQRIFVQQKVYDPFLEQLLEKVKGLKTGDPILETTQVGPLIDQNALLRTEKWIADAVSGGARCLAGGFREGTVFQPTVLTGTTFEMNVNCEEVFAPLVTVEPYQNFDQAVEAINQSSYGLQTGIFTHDIRKIYKAYEECEVGGVLVNDIPTFRLDHMPYGGVKESGLGREGLKYAIEEMTELKLLAFNFPEID